MKDCDVHPLLVSKSQICAPKQFYYNELLALVCNKTRYQQQITNLMKITKYVKMISSLLSIF